MQREHGMNNRGKAFTLVEILVVVMVVALLMAILLPSLAQVRQSAQNVECLSNQRQLGVAMFTHFNETGDSTLPMYDEVGEIFPESMLVCPSDPMPDKAPAGLFGNDADLALSYAINVEHGWHDMEWDGVATPSAIAYLFDGIPAMPNSGELAYLGGSPRYETMDGSVFFASSTLPGGDPLHDLIDTLEEYISVHHSGQLRMDYTHYPPGNPGNAKYMPDSPLSSVWGHLSHGCFPGAYSESQHGSGHERLQATFMRRHMSHSLGNVLMLDGHAVSAEQLYESMFLEFETGSGDGNNNGGGGGNNGGGNNGKGPA